MHFALHLRGERTGGELHFWQPPLRSSSQTFPCNCLNMRRDEKGVLTATATRAKLISDSRTSLSCGGMEKSGEDTQVPIYQGTVLPHPTSELCYVQFLSRIHSKAWKAKCMRAWKTIKTEGSFQSAEQPLAICFKGRKELSKMRGKKKRIIMQAGIPLWPSLQSGSGSSQLLLQMVGWHWTRKRPKHKGRLETD